GFVMKEKFRSRGHRKRWKDTLGSSPSSVIVCDEILVRWVMFCTNAVFVMLKSWRFVNFMVCFTSVSTRPCEVRTNPATENCREELTVTEPLILPLVFVRFSTTTGAGAGLRVLRVSSPVTTFDSRSWNKSSVAVVEKPLLALKTLTATWCGWPLLSRPAKGV